MIFHAHAALAIEMLALIGGMLLLMRVCKEELCCKLFFKIVSYAVILISFLLMLCTAYHSYIYWKNGFYCTPQMMGGPGMMGGKMEMMKEHMEEKAGEAK